MREDKYSTDKPQKALKVKTSSLLRQGGMESGRVMWPRHLLAHHFLVQTHNKKTLKKNVSCVNIRERPYLGEVMLKE